MSTTTERRKLVVVIATTAAAVVLVAAGAALIGWLAERGDDATVVQQPPPTMTNSDDPAADETEGGQDSEDSVTAKPFRQDGNFLPEPMGGQQAIDALGDDLEAVAEKNDRTADELRELLLRDKTVKVSPNGLLFYGDTATPNVPQ